MSKICQVTGKKPRSGQNRSHSMRATKRRFEPNLQTRTLIDPKTGKKVKMRVSAAGLRTLLKAPRVKKTAKKAK